MKDTDWEILYELHRNPNLTKVANLLYLTQPSLTKRLHVMENEFNVRIVNRTPKGLEFTEEGTYLAEQAEKYMKFLQETKSGLRLFKEGEKRPIIIGSSYTYSKYALTDLMLKYKEKNPRMEFEVVNDQSNILFRKVLDGSVDVGFVQGDYEGPVWQLCVGKNQGYAVTKDPVCLDDLPSMPRLNYKTNDRTKELLSGWWENYYGTEEPSGMVVGYVDVALQLVEKGLGYTCCFLPESAKNRESLFLTPLVRRDGTPVVRSTWFVYSKNKRRPPALEQFIRYVQEELGETGKRGSGS
ncbi:MAG TPA: LysR family transcriptional regulator [Candidatus Lachnoclostridium pullistercoris]|uniref:LysR family transcriptional regulator n=1 Tax=Candidatus Lachnoclostridium pullistercoris TaxID=2838632 RepID=A0A9D2PDE9_9FIRM|nr:LysR family transcriptional regulator [Candidatus Lachnoclostridium pullistercoris]